MILQHYAVEPGKIYAGEYPGSTTEQKAIAKIRHLAGLGVRVYIDLTEARDGLSLYTQLLPQIGEEMGVTLERVTIPIPDGNIPRDPLHMAECIETIKSSLQKNRPVYIHCWGGIGRTGTVVGCWLIERGMDPIEAVDHVQNLYATNMPKVSRMPKSPETFAQREYIRNWKPAKH